ncbi:hypothetical protein HMSSN036_44830 [Paenibacillus macerans]|nr:hypothetical protein HMSSN036_44830 [Paenibacillus macerans]
MIIRNLADIAAMCGGQVREAADSGIAVRGAVTDSRQITQDCLFIPLSGERFDGHDLQRTVSRPELPQPCGSGPRERLPGRLYWWTIAWRRCKRWPSPT